MPFMEATKRMNRERFVTEVLEKKATKAALCRKYGISRPTGDTWLKRYRDGEGFDERSRRPFRTPNKSPAAVEEKIVEMRTKEPAIGAVKIKKMLENKGEIDIPCASTINAILKRNDLITKEASQAATPHKRFEKEAPNVMWQADYKGHYAALNGQRCHPLSLIDDYSRFCLNADAKTNEQYDGTRESFVKAFIEYGLPDIVLCDNGNPWGASQSGGITRFEIWLMDLGILPIHIRPNRPQTQGKVERFNGSFKRERLKYYTPKDMEDAARQRSEYREFYNNERPHHAIDLDCPARRYRRSERAYTGEAPEWDYGDREPRKIKNSGYITVKGQGYYLSEALGGKTVAIKRSSTRDGVFNILYRQFRIARLDVNANAVIERRIYLQDGDPRRATEEGAASSVK